MHDVVLIEDSKCFHYLRKIVKSYFLWKRAFFLEQTLQSSSVTVFINKVKVVYSFEHIEIADDMGAVFEIGEDVNFINGSFLKFWKLLEFLCLDHLDGDVLFRLEVDGLVYFGIDS